MLEAIIRKLIASKREGAYWDFKAKPHANNANLLHDLLCLANASHQGARYLIIGVDDSARGANIVGLDSAEPGRKSQAEYITFLRNLPFAGGIRPEIELVTLLLEGREIDVLIIFDRPYKPYSITKDYQDRDRKVRAHYTYTRVGDTNTALNMSADPLHVEKMWRQRLGLDMLPVERMKQLLGEPEAWVKDLGNSRDAYHQNFPDYRIRFSTPKPFWEPYSYFFANNKSFLGTATFKLNTTTLFKLQYVYLDEMRLLLPAPDIEYVELPDRQLWYYYYNRSAAEGRFLLFLLDGRETMRSRGMTSPFLVFEQEQEQQEFNQFLVDHAVRFEEMPPGYAAEQAARLMQKEGKETVISPVDIGRVALMYQAWRQGLPDK